MAQSHGDGHFSPDDLGSCGQDCCFEAGVLVFHPQNIYIGANVYVGHYSILKAYHKQEMHVGEGTWIGQQCFLHSAGGIRIGKRVGIGPGVQILTSNHKLPVPQGSAIIDSPLEFAAVNIGDGADIGAGAILLPGASIGEGAQVGAGAVVKAEVPAGSIVAGVPARVITK